MESDKTTRSLAEINDLVAMIDELLKPSNTGRFDTVLPGVRITVRQIRETLNQICDKNAPLSSLGAKVEREVSDSEANLVAEDGSPISHRRKELRSSIERIMGLQGSNA